MLWAHIGTHSCDVMIDSSTATSMHHSTMYAETQDTETQEIQCAHYLSVHTAAELPLSRVSQHV